MIFVFPEFFPCFWCLQKKCRNAEKKFKSDKETDKERKNGGEDREKRREIQPVQSGSQERNRQQDAGHKEEETTQQKD